MSLQLLRHSEPRRRKARLRGGLGQRCVVLAVLDASVCRLCPQQSMRAANIVADLLPCACIAFASGLLTASCICSRARLCPTQTPVQTYMYTKEQESAMRQASGFDGPIDRVAALLMPLSAALARMQSFFAVMLTTPSRPSSSGPMSKDRAMVPVKNCGSTDRPGRG
jgi:hypothetical protein